MSSIFSIWGYLGHLFWANARLQKHGGHAALRLHVAGGSQSTGWSQAPNMAGWKMSDGRCWNRDGELTGTLKYHLVNIKD